MAPFDLPLFAYVQRPTETHEPLVGGAAPFGRIEKATAPSTCADEPVAQVEASEMDEAGDNTPQAQPKRALHRPCSERPGTLAKALAEVQAAGALDGEALRHVVSDLSTVSKVTGLPIDSIPCAPRELRPLLHKARPVRHGVKGPRWSSAKSSVARVLRLVDWLDDLDTSSRAPLGGVWQRAVDSFVAPGQRASFKAFARYCMSYNILPDAVSLQTMEAYGEWRADRTLILDVSTSVSVTRRLWRHLQRDLEGWPQTSIPAPRDPRRYAADRGSFTASFQEEAANFLRDMAIFKPLDPRFNKRYSPMTVKCTRHTIYRAATIIGEATGGAENVRTLRDICTPNAFHILMNDHCDRLGSGEGLSASSRTFAYTLKRVARRSGLMTAGELAELDRLAGMVKPKGTGLSRNARDRVAQFFDPDLLHALNKMPDRLMAEAAMLFKAGSADRAARLYCRGVQVAILLVHPLRRQNLATLSIERHLLRDKSGKINRLCIPASETKSGKEIEGPIEAKLAGQIETFIRLYRPIMLKRPSPYLWPGGHDGHLAPETVSRNIKTLVEASLGVDFNVHIIRHLVATLLLEANPRNLPLVQQILGHRDSKTTERIYGHARTSGAQKAWAEVLEQNCSRSKKRRRP